jgi:hypothetical protein
LPCRRGSFLPLQHRRVRCFQRQLLIKRHLDWRLSWR